MTEISPIQFYNQRNDRSKPLATLSNLIQNKDMTDSARIDDGGARPAKFPYKISWLFLLFNLLMYIYTNLVTSTHS